MKFRIAFLVFCLTFFTTEAHAAVKVVASKNVISANSTAESGDQIFDFSLSSTEIVLAGTIESELSN